MTTQNTPGDGSHPDIPVSNNGPTIRPIAVRHRSTWLSPAHRYRVHPAWPQEGGPGPNLPLRGPLKSSAALSPEAAAAGVLRCDPPCPTCVRSVSTEGGVSLAHARALVAPPSLCIFHTAIFRRQIGTRACARVDTTPCCVSLRHIKMPINASRAECGPESPTLPRQEASQHKELRSPRAT